MNSDQAPSRSSINKGENSLAMKSSLTIFPPAETCHCHDGGIN
jgi:hypothetical protein